MESRSSLSVLRVLAALMLVSAFGLWAIAQDDPDPNSPTPILLSEVSSTRALAQNEGNGVRVPLTKIPASQAFAPDSDVTIYLSDLSLMEGEGANAFRVYASDAQGHVYGFPVIDLQIVSTAKNVWGMTVRLTDNIGYWETKPDGDLSVYVTWRGLQSNVVKLGVGKISSDDAKPTDAKPTPLGTSNLSSRRKGADKTISPDFVGYRFGGDRRRFLEQATFGPTQAADDRIRRVGLRTWLNEQFAASYATVLPDCPNGLVDTMAYPCQPLKPANAPGDCDGDQTVTPDIPTTCNRDTYTMYPVQTWFMKYALHGDAQLRHRIAWSLGQIWVTSGVDIQQSRHMVEHQKILANNAFGNYRDLMKQMTLSPTMGDYLSMSQSTRKSPNENYAREIMQLFTVGLFMLNQDGTLQRDGNGDPIPSYSQDTVNNLTRVLTGWSFCSVQASCPNLSLGAVDYIDPMLFNSGVTTGAGNLHDIGAKTLLQYPDAPPVTIAACPTTTCFLTCPAAPLTTNCSLANGGTNAQAVAGVKAYAQNSLDQAIDNIYNHPNVGPFVSKTLIQQLVTSDPSPAYVSRVAGVFNANRSNPTQMKEVIKAILLDPEARGDVKTDPQFGKLREPVLLATNFARLFGVRSADGTGLSDGNLVRGRSEFTNMAQTPFMSPTVFNFYPPSYVIPGTSSNGPEFAILNTGTTIARANFFNRVVFSTVNPPTAASAPFPVTNPDTPLGTSFDFSDLQALSTADSTGGLLVDELNRRMLHSTMSAQMKATILPAVTSYATTDTINRVRQAVYLVATSSQFQVQR